MKNNPLLGEWQLIPDDSISQPLNVLELILSENFITLTLAAKGITKFLSVNGMLQLLIEQV